MNTEQKHTPGPWRVDYAQGIIAADGTVVAYVEADHSDTPTPDGNLIAAAPDLLEALKSTWKILDAAGLTNLATGVQTGSIAWYCKASDAEQQALAAIAKAEGKS